MEPLSAAAARSVVLSSKSVESVFCTSVLGLDVGCAEGCDEGWPVGCVGLLDGCVVG